VNTSSHSLLAVLAANGIDRVYQVPGESYIGILDALADFPAIDVVTCRHEAGAGFMACADGRLTRRPGVVMVSRGPGASNASIAVHTAQQDAVPLLLIVGQVVKRDLRRQAFQEIDYQKMFGSIAKWVVEATDPSQLGEIAFKAIRIATSGTPGPVVIVVPEDIQQQQAPQQPWVVRPNEPTTAVGATLTELHALLSRAERPLLIAGGAFDRPQGRETLLAFAEAWHLPVAVAFRRHDVFPNRHPLYVGDLGLSNRESQLAAFDSSDLILALGTRLNDITSQGYTFPQMPQARQTLVHCYPDDRIVGLHWAPAFGLTCDPVALAADLTPREPPRIAELRRTWRRELRDIFESIAAWPAADTGEGVTMTQVTRALAQHAPQDTIVCLDAGSFAAPVYRHFPFTYPQRLMAPISGAMGYGTPAAIAAQLRHPHAKVICMLGDGGFMMTGNEMIAAVERRLPILFILANNESYGSIRIHQEREYPGRHVGTSLFNPDFARVAEGFGMRSEVVTERAQVDSAIARGLAASGPSFIEVRTRLKFASVARGE
jgi:acetolactate synthase I/II/III large subunit